MTIKVELKPETEAWLVAGAQARGISVEEYAESLLRDAITLQSEGSGQLSVREVRAMLASIAEGSDKLPKLPTTAFTRESFYERGQ
jgi:hypothetical protein